MEQLNTVQPVEAEQKQPRDFLFRELSACTYRMISSESSAPSEERAAKYTVAMVAKAPETHPPFSTGQQVLPVEF